MNKKYYSTGEFYTIDQNGNKVPYSGYVSVKNGTAYIFDTEIALIPGDGYNTTVNLSDEYFDRNLDSKLELPHPLMDCTFGANDYLKQTVLNRIIKNLDENNRYIYKNCLTSRNDLPVADIIPVLSPWRELSATTTEGEAAVRRGNVTGWGWSNISYNFINNISDKSGTDWTWPASIWGQDWDTYSVVDSDFVLTEKVDENDNQLYAVFIAEKTKIRLFNLYLYPDGQLNRYSDPLVDLVTAGNTTNVNEEVNKRKFNTNNFDIKVISKVDPENETSFDFKEIAGIKLSGNYLYVVDKGLNGIFKYDISRCLSERGTNINNQILLVNKLYGLGDLNTPYFFNKPTSISAFGNLVAVLDKGNICAKIFDTDFNHLTTIRQGAFVRQNPATIQICPYDFKLDGQIVKAGAIFIVSEVSGKISIDVYQNNGTYIKNKEVKYLKLEKTEHSEPGSAAVASSEQIKKVEFSANDSNLYYIITSRRIIKLYLSNLVEPIGISSLVNKIVNGELTYGISWRDAGEPWSNALAQSGDALIWGAAQSTYPLAYPYNHCFSIGWNPDINSDIIFTISGNTIYYDSGTIHRVDNFKDNKKLYYADNDDLTYNSSNGDYQNRPVMVEVNSIVDEYSEDSTGKPVKTDNTFVYVITEEFTKRVYNTIVFYKEPNEYKSLLIRPDLKLYTLDEISTVVGDEYVSQLSLNKLLYKILFNLNEIKQYLYGTFTAGYSIENIMTYDSITMDYSIASNNIAVENFIFGENERVSIVLNRCFENVYKTQLDILNKIQTKFISATNYNLHAFKSI